MALSHVVSEIFNHLAYLAPFLR